MHVLGKKKKNKEGLKRNQVPNLNRPRFSIEAISYRVFKVTKKYGCNVSKFTLRPQSTKDENRSNKAATSRLISVHQEAQYALFLYLY